MKTDPGEHRDPGEGHVVCWTRMQAEAGQALDAIVARKEIERQVGRGLFFWGVGNPRPRVVPALVHAGRNVSLIFSRMKGQPKLIDVRPPTLLVWRRFVDIDGNVQLLPEHVLVTSRGSDRDRRRSHYALVCRSDRPLVFGDYGPFDPDAYCNLGGTGAPVGASQVTALLQRTGLPSSDPSYRINLRAELTGPLWVKLTDPKVLHGLSRTTFEKELPNVNAAGWRDFVAEARAGDANMVVDAGGQLTLL